jgi:hypothetical protein
MKSKRHSNRGAMLIKENRIQEPFARTLIP